MRRGFHKIKNGQRVCKAKITWRRTSSLAECSAICARASAATSAIYNHPSKYELSRDSSVQLLAQSVQAPLTVLPSRFAFRRAFYGTNAPSIESRARSCQGKEQKIDSMGGLNSTHTILCVQSVTRQNNTPGANLYAYTRKKITSSSRFLALALAAASSCRSLVLIAYVSDWPGLMNTP